MKLAFVVFSGLLCSATVFGQYSATTLTRRIAPQLGRAPAPTAGGAAQPGVPQASLASPPATATEKDAADKKLLTYQKSRADAGSDSAQYELGLRYLTGKGVEKDEVEGKKWLDKAAKQGNIKATKKLEELKKPVVTVPTLTLPTLEK